MNKMNTKLKRLLKLGIDNYDSIMNVWMNPATVAQFYTILYFFGDRRQRRLKRESDQRFRDSGAALDLIMRIGRMQEIPKFDKKNPTMDSELIGSLYTSILMVLNKFNIEPVSHKLNYLMSCFHGNSLKNFADLKNYASNEIHNPKQNDSRFYMELRSICTILRDNLNVLEEDYMNKLELELKPLFDNYSDQDYSL